METNVDSEPSSNFNKILLRCGEIFLKGKNQHMFERKLINNIKKIVGPHNLSKLRSRYILDYFPTHQIIKRVFGLVSYSLAIETTRDLVDIKKTALRLIKGKTGTFRVETKRSDKSFPIKSPDLNRIIGEFIGEHHPDFSFKLKNYDHCINIEINHQGVYLFSEKVPCFGGLPTGVEGKIGLFLDNHSSVLAGLLMMKRGVDIVCLCHNNLSEDFKLNSINILNKYSPTKTHSITFNNITEIEELVKSKNIDTIVSGQNFSEYTNQNQKLCFDSIINKTNNLIILRPLIAFSDDEIIKKINVYQSA